MKRICRDCIHMKSKRVGDVTWVHWCGLGKGKSIGIYPWKNKAHPKCPLRKRNYDGRNKTDSLEKSR